MMPGYVTSGLEEEFRILRTFHPSHCAIIRKPQKSAIKKFDYRIFLGLKAQLYECMTSDP